MTYLTPRFGTSHNVIGLVAPAGGETTLVGKLSRRPGDGERLRREATALRILAAWTPAIAGVPRLITLSEPPEPVALLETAVAGRRLGRRDLVGSREQWIDAVVAWTRPFATVDPAARPHIGNPPSIGVVMDRALRTWDRVTEIDDGLRRAIAAASRLLDAIRALDAPPCFEHGDLAPPNLLLTPEGGLGVVDWELAGPTRLPMQDLLFYLSHIAWESARGSTAQRLAAIDAAFLAGDGWAWAPLQRRAHELGVDPTFIPLLLLACWTRYAADTLDRVHSARTLTAYPARELEQVRRLRPYAIWRHLIDRLAGGAA